MSANLSDIEHRCGCFLDVGDCEHCQACELCCDCLDCKECGKVPHDTEWCQECDVCIDCCDKVTAECECHVDSDAVCENCKQCTECHSCWYCEACNRYRDEDVNQCRACDSCERCCDCYHCSHCGENHTRSYIESEGWCSECDSCERRCDCEKDCNINFIDRSVKFFPALLKEQRKLNPIGRMVAAEIEIARITEGHYIEDACRKWHCSIVTDGSLPDSGFEVNTSPAGGDILVEEITELINALNNGTAGIDHTCSTHIHIDARDFDYQDVGKLIFLYQHLEDALFALAAKHRARCGFCGGCGVALAKGISPNMPTPKLAWQIAYNTYGTHYGNPCANKCDRLKYLKTDQKPAGRYRALNIHSWFYRKTIECRMLEGCLNARRLISWSMVWGAILDTAKKLSWQEIDYLVSGPHISPNNSVLNGLGLLKLIAPTQKVAEWINRRYEALQGHEARG